MSTPNLITFRGQTKSVTEWAKVTGIPVASIFKRVEAGWDAERILTTKNRGIGRLSVIHQTEYRIWKYMRKRCRNKNAKGYDRYGGRGIYVCERWSEFAAFFADMGPRPSSEHSIERRDNSGPYSPENCYWATTIQQARNRRDNRILTFQGVSHTVVEWGEVLGISPKVIEQRINRCGWSVEDALATPARPRRKP